jgi:transposase
LSHSYGAVLDNPGLIVACVIGDGEAETGPLAAAWRDGRACIDNSAAERAMRPVALGRRNGTFAGSDAGGVRGATIYSLIETAKMGGLDPEACLCHVIQRIADHPVNRVAELLPWNLNGIRARLDQRKAA